ncbi:MAG TPA: hypothetical protein EYN91_14990 [Candidatus Melainabacteria bacterium]|jgi:hypothetical protein|nr:hypothetical protein [Candidatus Melainabacteria bacterium]HIN63937.1 hypothetical protein [Candidatus Obscuribacterales bacterium]
MKRLALSLLAVATVAAIASPAQAQNWLNLPSFQHWNLNSLVSNEQSRINAGRANGSLTPEEATRLQNRLNDINALKFQLSRDGLSPSDRATIDQQLDQLSQDVFRESNDRQMLGNNPWAWSRNYTPNNSNWRYGHWDNGRWISKNNWNQYNNWRSKNWHNEWNRRGDGVPGAGLTSQEQWQINKQRAQLQNKQAQMMSDGHLSRKERQQLQNKQNKLNQKEWRDRRD